MGFSLSRGCQVLCLLALAAMQRSDAFVPNSRAFRTTTSKSLIDKQMGYVLPTESTESALSMGVMEDFITGSDTKTRDTENQSYLAELQKRVDRINGLEPSIEDLGDDELQAKTEEFRARLKDGEDINGPILEEMFAVVREAAWYVSSISIYLFHLQHFFLHVHLLNSGECLNFDIMMCNSWVDLSSTMVDLQKWRQEKVKP